MDTHQPDAHLPSIAPDDAPPETLVQGDNPPSRGLFITLFVLSLIVAASMVGLWQLTSLTINNHRAASAPDPRLVNLRASNIASLTFPEPSCAVPETCNKGGQAIMRVPLSAVLTAMTQEWAAKPNNPASLIAPFGPKATP